MNPSFLLKICLQLLHKTQLIMQIDKRTTNRLKNGKQETAINEKALLETLLNSLKSSVSHPFQEKLLVFSSSSNGRTNGATTYSLDKIQQKKQEYSYSLIFMYYKTRYMFWVGGYTFHLTPIGTFSIHKFCCCCFSLYIQNYLFMNFSIIQ